MANPKLICIYFVLHRHHWVASYSTKHLKTLTAMRRNIMHSVLDHIQSLVRIHQEFGRMLTKSYFVRYALLIYTNDNSHIQKQHICVNRPATITYHTHESGNGFAQNVSVLWASGEYIFVLFLTERGRFFYSGLV